MTLTIPQKMHQINMLINEIHNEDPGVAKVLRGGFEMSLDVMDQILKNEGRPLKEYDVSKQIEVVCDLLDIDIEQLVMQAIDDLNQQGDIEQKAADEKTLAFITADEDVDDYETFLEENKVKENLDFLKGEI